MPLQARTTSAIHVYHTILRGVIKQQVFDFETSIGSAKMINIQHINICCVSGVPVRVFLLAGKLQEVVSKPLKKVDYDMGKYDWDKIARQVNDVYKSIRK